MPKGPLAGLKAKDHGVVRERNGSSDLPTRTQGVALGKRHRYRLAATPYEKEEARDQCCPIALFWKEIQSNAIATILSPEPIPNLTLFLRYFSYRFAIYNSSKYQ